MHAAPARCVVTELKRAMLPGRGMHSAQNKSNKRTSCSTNSGQMQSSEGLHSGHKDSDHTLYNTCVAASDFVLHGLWGPHSSRVRAKLRVQIFNRLAVS